jgi:hypothetical protein
MYMTINEITDVTAKTKSPHTPNTPKTPQQRKRERETEFEKNAKALAAKKRALKPKSPQ